MRPLRQRIGHYDSTAWPGAGRRSSGVGPRRRGKTHIAGRFGAPQGIEDDLVHCKAAKEIWSTLRQLNPQNGGARCPQVHENASLPENAPNPGAGGPAPAHVSERTPLRKGAARHGKRGPARKPDPSHCPVGRGDGPVPGAVRYFTRSFWSMRCRNAAMSQRAIWS